MIKIINNRTHLKDTGYDFTPPIFIWTKSNPTKIPLPLPNGSVNFELETLKNDFVYIEIINMKGPVKAICKPSKQEISLPKDSKRLKHTTLGFLIINSKVNGLVSTGGKSVQTTENITIEEDDPGN